MMKERRKGKVRTKSGKSCRLIHSGMDYTHIFFSSFFSASTDQPTDRRNHVRGSLLSVEMT